MKSEISIANVKSNYNFILTKAYGIILPAAFLLSRTNLIKGLMPFGLPLYIAAYGLNVSKIAVALTIILGMLTANGSSNTLITGIAMLLFSIVNITIKSRTNTTSKHTNNKQGIVSDLYAACMGAMSTLIPSIVFVYVRGMLLYDLIIALFQTFIVFVLVFIMKKATIVVDENRDRKTFTNEELISVAIVGALIISSLGDIKFISFSIKNVISILAVLIFSFRCGVAAGASVGVTAGLILSMSSTVAPLLIGCYAFCGLLSGVFKTLGKIGTSLGFLLGNIILTIYLNGSMEALILMKELILAILIFMLIPQKLIIKIPEALGVNTNSSKGEAIFNLRAKEVIISKLNKFSNTFMEVSKTFNEISPAKAIINNQDVSSMLDRVADRICKDCSLCLHCWDKNFYSTYQVMFKIVEKLDNKGFIEREDIPQFFINRCERTADFITTVNNMYEIFKVDMMWKNKLGENRNLVSKQLEELSKAITGLADEIEYDIDFKSEIENTISLMLKREGIRNAKVLAFENKHGKYEVSVSSQGCEGEKVCSNIIEKIVSHVVGKKMVKENLGCTKGITDYDANNKCMIKFVEEEAYSITTGVACVSKHDERYGSVVNGDSYAFINTNDGKFVAALSDGMGSGEKAAFQSRTTINLIEQFMETGFDKDITIKLINSILALNSSDDYYSTIDLSVIDLDNGKTEFVKIGAAPTYIKRNDKIEVIKTASLPAGILGNMEVELVSKQLADGDMLIMISDGILDSYEDIDKNEDKEKMFIKHIEEIKSINPQTIADIVLDKAYKKYDGKPSDDMTVIVVKFWKKLSI